MTKEGVGVLGQQKNTTMGINPRKELRYMYDSYTIAHLVLTVVFECRVDEQGREKDSVDVTELLPTSWVRSARSAKEESSSCYCQWLCRIRGEIQPG
jgi:hypothetical protein